MSGLSVCCPVCAAAFPLEAGLNDADARRCVVLVGELPPAIARLVVPYLRLFAPPTRGLTWSRAARLLEDLVPHVTAGEVSRRGSTYPAPPEHWLRGLQTVLDQREQLRLPLRGHGYLIEILVGQAEKMAAKAETQREVDRQAARHRPTRPAVRPTEPAAARAHMQAVLGTLKGSRKGGDGD